MVPDNAWEGDNDPIQGAKEEALDRVTVFMGTETVVLLGSGDAEKKKDTQGQSPTVSRQIGNHTVVEGFAAAVSAAD